MCTDKLVNKILDYFLNICSIRNKRKTDSDILATQVATESSDQACFATVDSELSQAVVEAVVENETWSINSSIRVLGMLDYDTGARYDGT